MNYQPIHKDIFFTDLPPEWPDDLLPEIREKIAAHPRKVVVLDDDPDVVEFISLVKQADRLASEQ